MGEYLFYLEADIEEKTTTNVQTKALNILGTKLGKTTAGTKLVTGETNQMKTRQGK